MRGDAIDKTCLSWWFPRIHAARLPVPKTRILRFDDDMTHSALMAPFDGEPMGLQGRVFLAQLRGVIEVEFALPVFLRTGMTSGKHSWNTTCALTDLSLLERHVLALIEFSECADMMGLPWNVWVVREFLPAEPGVAVCPNYDGMPVRREVRAFATKDRVTGWQPYWTPRSLAHGGLPFASAAAAVRDVLEAGLPADVSSGSVQAVAALDDQEWSVDWLLVPGRGWVLTDMAEAQTSFRWDPTDQKEWAPDPEDE